MIWRLLGGTRGAIVTAIALLLASPLFAPQLLAFPYKAEIAGSTVWSEQAIPSAALQAVMERSHRLIAASPIAVGAEPRRVYLTDGGWRWSVLSLTAHGSFGLTRAFTDPVIVVNRSDLARDRVWNGSAAKRSLSGVIAHETMHGVLRDRYGRIAVQLKPQWLVEGYCDFVARESTLTRAQAESLETRDEAHPALPYYRGRQKVAAILAANGGNVDALFRESH